MATPKSIRPPAFQYYPKDFLTDANVLAMSLTERGAYWTLISVCWLEGTLPAGTKPLARLLGVTDAHMARLWPALAPCFRERQGRLTHPRLDRELQKQRDFRDKQAANGRRGGRKPKEPTALSGLAQTEAKESSSISSLQSPVFNLQTASKTTTAPPHGAPIHPKRNLRAAWEGTRGLYVVEGQHQKFRSLLNLPDGEAVLFAWYADVAREWTLGAKSSANPGTDMVKFWDARHAEKWPVDAVPRVDPKLPEWARQAQERKAAGVVSKP